MQEKEVIAPIACKDCRFSIQTLGDDYICKHPEVCSKPISERPEFICEYFAKEENRKRIPKESLSYIDCNSLNAIAGLLRHIGYPQFGDVLIAIEGKIFRKLDEHEQTELKTCPLDKKQKGNSL